MNIQEHPREIPDYLKNKNVPPIEKRYKQQFEDMLIKLTRDLHQYNSVKADLLRQKLLIMTFNRVEKIRKDLELEAMVDQEVKEMLDYYENLYQQWQGLMGDKH